MALIELFSELCLGRNYSAMNILGSLLPIELLVSSFEDVERNKLSDEIKSVFCRLLLRLHIDTKHSTPMNLPCYTRAWNESQEDLFPCSKFPSI